MTPQSSFMVLARLNRARVGDLRSLLVSMNRAPGTADPTNELVSFQKLERLHFARLVILDDITVADIACHGVAVPELPVYLAFLGDFDGEYENFLRDLIKYAEQGLKRIFAHCEDFEPGSDLFDWFRAHETSPATMYVNWRGRTVKQIREENALTNALKNHLAAHPELRDGKSPAQIASALREFVAIEQRAGRLSLADEKPTPWKWRIGNIFHLIGVPVALLLLTPLLILYLPVFLIQLRAREKSDPEIVPRPGAEQTKVLADREDIDVTNQFTAIGSVKPGLFRRWTLTFFLWIVDYTTRHIYSKGHLTRVGTIHFARWVFLDEKKRLLFASNYDGGLDSYMDDFINKVGWGLNLVFGNGVGYPRTNWLILDGANDEQKFKYYIRRHELPTEVWYNAHPGLTAFDLQRNSQIRQGLQCLSMTENEIQQWLNLF